jgi:hypothetical protein
MEKRSPCWLAQRVKSNVSGVAAAEGASSVAGLVQAPPGARESYLRRFTTSVGSPHLGGLILLHLFSRVAAVPITMGMTSTASRP